MTQTDMATNVTTLFESWRSSPLRYALQIPLRYEKEEDLVQETFLQFHSALRAGRHIEHPKAWILCVLRRSIHTAIELESRYAPLEQLEQTIAVPHNSIDSIALRDLLSQLSERERQVVLLRLDNLKYRKIADQLHISTNSVDTFLGRALKKLGLAFG